jgi:hypothetical protein
VDDIGSNFEKEDYRQILNYLDLPSTTHPTTTKWVTQQVSAPVLG